MSAADVTAVLAIGAALCGGIWLLLTRSTDRRIDEERQRKPNGATTTSGSKTSRRTSDSAMGSL